MYLRKFHENGLFHIGNLCHLLKVLFKPPLHRLNGMHLLFQQPGSRGILPRYRLLLVLHFLLNPPELLLLFFVLASLLPRELFLFAQSVHALTYISPVIRFGNRMPGPLLFSDLFEMNDFIRRALKQRLVVGNIEHRPSPFEYKRLQPLQRPDVDIIRWLVQKQNIRLSAQQAQHTNLNLLPAR